MMTIRYIITRGVLAGSLLLSANTMADTMTGRINASIEVINSCEINGMQDGKTQNFGTLNFGTVTTFFSQADAVLDHGISIKCAPGHTTYVVFQDNSHYMTGPGNNIIYYKVYSDSTRTKELTSGSRINSNSDGTAKNIPIYARAFGPAGGLHAGSYHDTFSVAIYF